MAKLDIAPTKSKLLELRKGLTFAIEGRDLLEQKRTILTIELMSHLEAIRTMEKDLEPLVARAFAALRDAALEAGSDQLHRLSFNATLRHDVEIRSRPLMGLRLPVLETTFRDVPPRFGQQSSSARVDEVAQVFTAVLKAVAQLAELQSQVVRLARELKKTQRRNNALDKLFIPNYRDTIKYITESLEEREREGLVVIRMIKTRLGAAAAEAGDSGR
jgi:V/A-type H+/Na+-transporting ATPase subunit D